MIADVKTAQQPPPQSFEAAVLEFIRQTMRPREPLKLWFARTQISFAEIAKPILRRTRSTRPGYLWDEELIGIEWLMSKDELQRRVALADQRNAENKLAPEGALAVPEEPPPGPRIWTI